MTFPNTFWFLFIFSIAIDSRWMALLPQDAESRKKTLKPSLLLLCALCALCG
jgi:hypothetical protein